MTVNFLMARTRCTPLMLMAILLILILKSESDPGPRPLLSTHPLCISQFALASHACALIPYDPDEPDSSALPTAPPSSLVPHPDFNKLSHGHHHGHKHSHHHHHHHHETNAQEECCRWLKAIDDMCICDLLVRLPVFLSRPIHGYKVVVDDECEVEYECPGRLKP